MKNMRNKNKKMMLTSLLLATVMTMAVFVPAGMSTSNQNINKERFLSEQSAQILNSHDVSYEIQKILASDGEQYDNFGYSVAINGDIAIIGARGDDNHKGSAYIYRYEGSTWVEEQKLLASDGEEGDKFGCSVAIDNDVVIVGAFLDENNGYLSGSAYVYRYDGSTWIEGQKLIPPDAGDYDVFGCSVAIDDDIAVIGAYLDYDFGICSGSAYIFRYNGSTWIKEQKLLALDGKNEDYFGYSVAVDSDVVIIGAYQDWDNGYKTGSAYIFHYNGSTWIEEQKLMASDGYYLGGFGYSVAIDDNVAVIGAYTDCENGGYSGAAYIFYNTGEEWIEDQKLMASDGVDDDFFGSSVAIDGNILIIGAIGGIYYPVLGYAYVYRNDGSAWIEEQKLMASDVASDDYFGFSVAISDTTAIVGAMKDDNENGPDAGSAYVFNIPIPGDINGDGKVNIDDIFEVLAHWGESGGPADANGDGIVDIDDIFFVLAHWGEAGGPADANEDGVVDIDDVFFVLAHWT